jgi:hypothetical protein
MRYWPAGAAVLTGGGLLALALAAPSSAPVRGYHARACGFDLDRDGIVGEVDDCHVCDARLEAGLVTSGTPDPDGDGVDEDLVYVDCDGGKDTPGCGLPGNPPCATLAYGFGRIVDGPGDGIEDIVCFKGTCREPANLTPRSGGVPGAHIRPVSGGSEHRGFEFPSNPAMLSGWDSDADGAYPPFDADDTAVLEAVDASRAFDLNANGADNSYFEMAHFTARDYGRRDHGKDGGFMRINHGSPRSHLYLHDLSLQNINMDRQADNGRSTFNWFAIRDYSHLAFINIEALNVGSYFNRGSGSDGQSEAGPVRWQNITFTAHSCDFSGPEACPDPASAFSVGWKLWGYISRLEILDSVFDANVTAWIAKPSGGPAGATAIGVAQCSRDWMIRNNEFIDMKRALSIQAWARGFCAAPDARPVDGIVFDRNLVRNGDPYWKGEAIPIGLAAGGPSLTETNGDITISGNILWSTKGWRSAVQLNTGNAEGANPGAITITGNTFYGAARRGVLSISSRSAFPNQSGGIVLRDNVFSNTADRPMNVSTNFAVEGWDADHNVFGPGGFVWNRSRQSTLAEWQAASSGDRNSRSCVPRFADLGTKSTQPPRLAQGDPCAGGAAESDRSLDQRRDGATAESTKRAGTRPR